MVKSFFWTLYGGTIRNPDLRSGARSFLFICKGNICRSPFAEHIAYKIMADLPSNSAKYSFSSAGIRVSEPTPPPAGAISSAKRYGIEMHGHKSRSVDYELMESHDMIVVMETWQYRYLKKLFLEFEDKIFLLPMFDTNKQAFSHKYIMYNIQDPYEKKLEDYIACYDRISKCISNMISKMNQDKRR